LLLPRGSRTARAIVKHVRTVTVRAPARLHFGFLDLSGSTGRRFGSVGLTLDWPGVVLRAGHAAELAVSGEQASRAEECARTLLSLLRLRTGCRIEVLQAIPAHVGLGSGTQLALAVGAALTCLNGLDRPIREVASLYERGQRSGIGIGAFEAGGFLIDGGRGERDAPPPIVVRALFPEPWRVLLILDRNAQGLHGAQEAAAFQALDHFPEAVSARLCRQMLMQALPALQEADLDAFGRAIGDMQRVTGDYFAPAQGGRFASPPVSAALQWLESLGIQGTGQSSWGPTGFAILGSEREAQSLAEQGTAKWGTRLEFRICKGRNRGGDIEAADVVRDSAVH
jgi:beta-RFAP synthase